MSEMPRAEKCHECHEWRAGFVALFGFLICGIRRSAPFVRSAPMARHVIPAAGTLIVMGGHPGRVMPGSNGVMPAPPHVAVPVPMPVARHPDVAFAARRWGQRLDNRCRWCARTKTWACPDVRVRVNRQTAKITNVIARRVKPRPDTRLR